MSFRASAHTGVGIRFPSQWHADCRVGRSGYALLAMTETENFREGQDPPLRILINKNRWSTGAVSYRADHPMVLDDRPPTRHAIGRRGIPATIGYINFRSGLR